MKSRGNFLNLLGIVLGIITLGIIVFSTVYLTHNRPFMKWWGYDFTEERTFAPWEDIEEEERIDAKFDTLEIANFSGRIEIRGWDKDYTLVRWVKRGPFAEDLKVNIETSGKKLMIHLEDKTTKRRPLSSVSFEIDVSNEIEEIYVETVSGSIVLSGMSAQVDQRLKTVSGKIETDNSRDLHITTTSGSIKFRFSGSKLYAKTVSGSIHGDILDLEERGAVDLAAVSGSININAFRGLSARVNLKSTSGSVFCGFPLDTTLQKKNNIEGKIGTGTIPFNVKTTSGSIRLEKL